MKKTKVQKSKEYNDAVVKAVKLYLDRKTYVSHPPGYQDDDDRWHLSSEEIRPCCSKVQSRFLFNSHARSIEHISALFSVQVSDVQRMIAEVER